MRSSSKNLTAIKMFIDLGEHYEEGFVTLNNIANRKDVSKKFLEQIESNLIKDILKGMDKKMMNIFHLLLFLL